jgi:hypothetical protein
MGASLPRRTSGLVLAAGALMAAINLFWVLQFAMMVDVPGAGRRVHRFLTSTPMLDRMLRHADRGLMLGLFVCLPALAIERGRRLAASGGRSRAGEEP